MPRGFHTQDTWSLPWLAPYPCCVPSTDQIFPFFAIQQILIIDKLNKSAFVGWSEALSYSRSICCRQSPPNNKMLVQGLWTMSEGTHNFYHHIAEELTVRAGVEEGREGVQQWPQGLTQVRVVPTMTLQPKDILTEIFMDMCGKRQSTGIRKHKYLNFLDGELGQKHVGVYSKDMN